MIGQSIGRYTIESKLGEGGMGVVYRARDTQLGRIVAIKILPPDAVADADHKRRFVVEAKAASALNHPHIITIHDIGSHHGTDFIVMEHVDGSTLEQAIPAHGLPLTQVLRYAVQIADALAKAHEAGIIHRDLKPSNLMVTDNGAIKILDFGVAKLLDAAEPSAPTKTKAVTEEGTAVGTPAYMSPEQAEGRKLDGRSDIFSFGAVLYEMTTGRQAFRGESRLSVLAKVLNEEPLPASQINSSISLDFEKILARCLRKDPARRFQTMADLKVALEDLASDSTTNAPTYRPSRVSTTVRRWPVMAAAVIVIAAGAYFTAQSWRPSPTPGEPLRALPLTSLTGVLRQPSLSPDGNHVVFTWTGPKQDNTDLYLQQVGTGSHIRLTSDPANDYSPSWAPDGRAIAFLRRGPNSLRNEIRIIPPLGGTERRIADIQPGIASYRPLSLAWCPDSTCVLATDSPGNGTPDAIFVISIETGEKRQLTFPRISNPKQRMVADVDPAISPDARWLVFRRDHTPFSGEFFRLALGVRVRADGEPVKLTPSTLAGKPVWTSDSREILFGERGALWRLDVVNAGSPTRLPFVGQDGSTPTVARMPDGRQRLVYVRSVSDSNVWRIDTSAPGVPPTTSPVPAIATPRAEDIADLAADERRLAFMSNRSGEYEVWVANLDGSDAIKLTSLSRVPGFPRWSPDGKRVAFHSDPQERPDVLMVPADGGKLEVLTASHDGGGFPSFSRDGQSVYYSGSDSGREGLFKIAVTGGPPTRITTNTAAISVESLDGRDLYYVEAVDRPSALWRTSGSGDAPRKVLEGVILGAFDLTDDGIYYIDRDAASSSNFSYGVPGGARLQYFDFATARSTTVVQSLGAVRPGLTATRDGRSIFFSRIESAVDELMLVDNFQ